jgi:predicted DNA-binding WGR domain protein
VNWYDKFAKERILINVADTHSKYWAAYLDEATATVHVRWGRLGTKGGQQAKTFPHASQAVSYISTKFNEKQRKGYTDKIRGETIDAGRLEKLSIEAAIVGTQNKCQSMEWVEITSADDSACKFARINDTRIYEPDCTPGLLVTMETKKTYHQLNDFSLLFTGDAAFLADQYTGIAYLKVEKKDPLYELTQKVEEAVGRSLSK